jgi:putative FmdB family regulatory protein
MGERGPLAPHNIINEVLLMPIFEFHCQSCDKDFEKLVFGGDPEVECPFCGQNRVEKLMSACSAKVGYKFTATSNPKGASCSGCSSGSCSTCG